MDYRDPIVGETIYIPSSIHIDRGEDDIAGGIAVVSEIHLVETTLEYNKVFVSLKDIKGQKNWRHLLENQSKYEEMYNGLIAHNDPDYRETPYKVW